MKRKSPTTLLPFTGPVLRPLPDILSHVGLGSPFTTSLSKRHVADEDLSIPERSLRNKRGRCKICRKVQFAESTGQLKPAPGVPTVEFLLTYLCAVPTI